ncbi:MAG: hypothetical protein GY759_16530 [Chloroflexi bacterium]|nr:hypothetical protein [Chloroflexota bacterium]
MKPLYKRLFWAAIAIILLLGVDRIVTWPTGTSGDSQSPVLISEFMAANQTTISDEDGEYGDWIELYNRSLRDVNLGDWTLTDDPNQPDKWMFPEIVLPADEHLLLFASAKDRLTLADSVAADSGESPTTFLHTNFRLKANGGYLALYDPSSRRYLDASEVIYPGQVGDKSYGLCPGSRDYCYLDQPSPGETNVSEKAQQDLVAAVHFSDPRGYYDAPLEVALSSDTPEAVIYYTTNGNAPSEANGILYETPILIDRTTVLRATAFKPDMQAPASVTHTYLFKDDVLRQPNDPAGWPETWGTHRISIADYTYGEPVQSDYGLDPDIVNDPEYGPMLSSSLEALPVISLVTDLENLDIYFEDPQMRGPEAERPASVELFYPDGGREGFQTNVGARLQGGFSRWEYMPKHSFRLFFKSDYGPSKLAYQLFPDSFVSEFDTLVMRAGANRSFMSVPENQDPGDAAYARDQWGRASQIEMSGVGSHGIFAHLYLNGLYWGLYNVVERPDASFASSYYGGNKETWYAANHGGSVSGQWDRFATLIRLAEEGGLTDPEKYATMLEFIDPEHFSDYVILNWYAGTEDWPDNNWYADVQLPAGQNRFFVWDMELSWDGGAGLYLGSDGKEGAPFPNVVKLALAVLFENPDFRLLFADRVYKHLANDGALSDENAKARWLAITDVIEPAIVAESARWGDVRFEEPITPADWQHARAYVLAQMDGNGDKLIRLLREDNYYPAIDPPQWSQIGGLFEDSLTLKMSAPAGSIYYTLDGSDPRAKVTGEVSDSAIVYTEPVEISTETTVKSRLKEGDTWSAMREATFTRVGQHPDVRITELMYNPPGGSDYEYIELKNVGDATMNLSNAYIDGIDYRFPLDTSLSPGDFIVLIRDFLAFREMQPEADFHGFYTGKLANEGETITLLDAQGDVITSVSYGVANGWPLSANGGGDSLVLADLQGDPDDPQGWRASHLLYGSPGRDEPEP